mmetsp:Transcript_23491/g.69219  ORF Transcript_23491/g.69219 Transcript_23491/m.69219 type:complete len:112 (-) Transcript_23491:149-484(-)
MMSPSLRLRERAAQVWARARILTQNADDSPFQIPWKSWIAAGMIISALYAVDLPEHARRLKEGRERARLDEMGMPDVHRELGDGRYLMRDGSIRTHDDIAAGRHEGASSDR